MSKGTLFDKVWNAHTVKILPSGQTQLFIGLHLIHEVTSPQAFAMLRERGLKVLYPDRTVATVDHIVPTENQARPFADTLAEEMMQSLENSAKEYGIRFYNIGSGNQGIVHVIAPEQGLTQPGMTIACGDSHTSTHGAFGAIAFGIGTSQVRDVLASQTLALGKLKVRKIEVNGALPPGVYAKDVVLHIIRKLGVKGGVGYAYEYAGTTFAAMSMEERMTVCNMSIEGGARCGYINPDDVTFEYLKGRDFAPQGEDWEQAVTWWRSMASDADAEYDDIVRFDASEIEPTITWGITPGQGIGVSESIPTPDSLPEGDRAIAQEAYEYMQLSPGTPIKGTKVDVCFIGSCTNGRISDLREAAKVVQGHHVAPGVKAFVVPGSERVKVQAEAEGLDKIFEAAGFEWREAGCSMCLAMNPDKLQGDQISASSSNRNFKGRQGSSTGRTLLMSPAMVVAAAVNGKVSDIRELN
ncbi:3-isopropylmalate dehydratase large subunit [Crocosphaera sp. UHCC 0190]|uniref:3-isopropylmalate dehydratase large subunit n=1 Tax=Crocosphaera sp. UHCC 0190 TaxID=3110246 RepID=UPI002B1ED590|nr:3-isopropylmalate dehydratase large subunit [Crocosphaera sp. UHCC 0190]MEA5511326.1 3-isopropylmalate dehydratase large subunit [Crocosphaera sp. UHCC 0190]